jgi:hypothetical protein
MKADTSTRTYEAGARGMPTRRWVCERALAEYAGLSIRTLQNWRLRCQGPPFRRLGGSVRYDLTGFDEWAAQQPGGGGTISN